VGKGEGLAGKPDLGYIITDEQIEEKRLAQAPQGGEKSQRKAAGRSQGGKKIKGLPFCYRGDGKN
jgi:hypothetical protein